MCRTDETWVTHLSGSGPDQEAALSDLRDMLLRSLRRAFASRALADDSFLEDAVQDSLLRVLDRLRQFEGRSRFLTWATSIAIRVAMTELRRRHWKDVSLDSLIADSDFTPDTAIDDESGPDAQLAQKALLEKMHAVIQNELTGRQRTALLAELKGMPQDEIARQLGSNRNAVYKLTHDARKRLLLGLQVAGFQAGDIHAAFAK